MIRPPSRTLLELSGVVLFAALATAMVASAAWTSAAADEPPTTLSFPSWELDCADVTASAQKETGGTAVIRYVPYDLTFTAQWVIDQRAPSTGHLRLAGVGERNTKAVAKIITVKEQLDWAAEVQQKGWDPAGPEARALAASKGSVRVKETDDRGNIEFRFGWWMFAPTDKQLQIHMRGCKSTSNYDADKTFLSLTYPNASVTITNAERVETTCVTCQVSQLFDCEHVELTPVLLNSANMGVVLDDADRPLDPIRTDGNPLVTPPRLDSESFDPLARVKDGAKSLLDASNLESYSIHPEQRLANTGNLNSAGIIGYFVGPGAAQQMLAAPDAAYRLAGAKLVAAFSDFFSIPENQTMNVKRGMRGYIIQPTRFSDFSTDVRLTCGTQGGGCGITQNGQVILDVNKDLGSVNNPLQLGLFIEKRADDRNADGTVNDLDRFADLTTSGPCKADVKKCAYTVKGTIRGVPDGTDVHLYSGGDDPRYATKTVKSQGGAYTFADVFPGAWAVKVEQAPDSHPCPVVRIAPVGVKDDLSGWKIEDNTLVSVPEQTASCWSQANAD